MVLAHDSETAVLVARHSDRLFSDLATPALLAAADSGEWPAQAWSQVADSGFLDVLVPADRGGASLAQRDALALARTTAYHALPLPIGETVLARGLWAMAGGALDETALPWTLASADGGSDGVQLEKHGGSLHAQGKLARVAWGRQAQSVIAAAQGPHGRPCLVKLVPDRASMRLSHSIANEPRDTLAIETRIDADCVQWLEDDGAMPLTRLAGALLRAHQMVGAMQRCVEMSLAYAAERSQFGSPIGKFPAVQSMLVDMAGELTAAMSAAELAATRWDSASWPALELLVAIAKSRTGEAAGKVAAACHQVHGAMGFTQEHTLHHFSRRLWSWRDEFGGESAWTRRIGQVTCANGGAALWPTITAL